MITRSEKAALEEGLGGDWLLYVVGTQSLAILAVVLSTHASRWRGELLAGAACLHTGGDALYFVLIALIARRLLFLPLAPEGLRPSYWITMGASAISTPAGAELAARAGAGGFVHEALPALLWSGVLFWSVSTAWLPLLVLLNAWRYLVRRVPVAYEAGHWSMVFPLGMYSACSFQLAQVTRWQAPAAIARGFAGLAAIAWVAVLAGLVRSVARSR